MRIFERKGFVDVMIEVDFLGAGEIRYGGKVLTFPFARARACAFLLLSERTISRTALAETIWGGSGAEKGRRNLRNALSALRKEFPPDFLNCSKGMLYIAPQWPVVTDLEKLKTPELCTEAEISALIRPFLEGFELPDAPEFELWLERKREDILRTLLVSMRCVVSKNPFSPSVAFLMQKILQLDPFDEETLRRLMRYFFEKGASPKALVLYDSFRQKLRDELNCMPEPRTQALYDAILKDASEPHEDLRVFLDILSFFEEPAPAELVFTLAQNMGLPKFRLADTVESLIARGRVYEEYVADRLCYSFCDQRDARMRLQSLSETRRMLLTEDLFRVLKMENRNNPGTFVKCCLYRKDTPALLEWKLHELVPRCRTTYELFPLADDEELCDGIPSPGDVESTSKELLETERFLLENRKSIPETVLSRLEPTICLLRGNYLRWKSSYAAAVCSLEKGLVSAGKNGESFFVYCALLEALCCLHIQTEDAGALKKYAVPLYRLAMEKKSPAHIGTALRFLGVLHILYGNYDSAERALEGSIERFSILESEGTPYTLALVAALQYKGDILLRRHDYVGARATLEQCIRICRERRIFRALPLLQAKTAYAAANLCEWDRVEEDIFDVWKQLRRFFLHSSEMMGMEMLWGGSISYALYAGLESQKGHNNAARFFLSRSGELSLKLKKPFWEDMALSVHNLRT